MPSVTAERPAYGGFSIARVDGAVLFVRGAIPGEAVEARIDEQKKDYAFSTAIEIISPSADRVQPECRHFGDCGGCHMQYISYGRQVSIKEEILFDSVRRGAKVEIPLSPSIFDDNPWGYRHRGRFKISGDSIGFFREKSKRIVDIKECPLMVREINGLLSRTADLLKSDQRLFQDISGLHISYGDSGTALLMTDKRSGASPDAPKITSALLDIGFDGVCVEAGHKIPMRGGAQYTNFDLNGLKYTVSPQTFFQCHWRLNTRVVRHIRDGLQPLAGKKVIDLYSGAGNFALPLALDAEEVVAVEDARSSIEDGKRNARLNNIGNCRFVKCPAERFSEACRAYAVIVDPPRMGLIKRALDKILEIKPERIVYISCNPSTFARDLKTLLTRYEAESLRLIDFFPQTYHIESVAFLRLR
jgi:23S rRNA (uracil1939-C5)-methyltransferase